ncbi:hypothetical protein [Anaerotalea alkaliphila]|uniref:hypothetical protein n=1 Tax=Anaerotalea alkaliphila TaxID=2662126 RepID=UPI001BA95D59|nr:hypothetical protein [Anaerotalea alkaliphila]
MRYSSGLFHQAASKASRVVVLQPGFLGGRVVDQHRGSRKLSIVVEGSFQRTGAHTSTPDVMRWFLGRAEKVSALSREEERLTIAVQEVQSERYSMLLPHRVRATVHIAFLDGELADQAEARLQALFTAEGPEEVKVFIQKLEERPPLNRSASTEAMTRRLQKISEEWGLPFGVDSGLLPTAAGEVPPGIPVVCGVSPASKDMFTPNECIHRGELLQRALLLALFLLEEE